MSKVILQLRGMYKTDDIYRLNCELKQDFDKNGFIVIDDRYKVYVIEDEKETDKN
jgi:hypothetical protein